MLELSMLFGMDRSPRINVLSHLQDTTVSEWWQRFESFDQAEKAKRSDMVVNKIEEYTTNRLLKPIIGQSRSTIDFREVIDRTPGNIVLVRMYGDNERMTQLIGALVIAQLLNAALSRQGTEREKRRQFHIYCDEFELYATDDFTRLLKECRKYSMGMTIAHQSREGISLRNKAASLQVANIIVGRVIPDDAHDLAPLFNAEGFPGEPKLEPMMERAVHEYTVTLPMPPEIEDEYFREYYEAIKRHGRELVLSEALMFSGFAYYLDDLYDYLGGGLLKKKENYWYPGYYYSPPALVGGNLKERKNITSHESWGGRYYKTQYYRSDFWVNVVEHLQTLLNNHQPPEMWKVLHLDLYDGVEPIKCYSSKFPDLDLRLDVKKYNQGVSFRQFIYAYARELLREFLAIAADGIATAKRRGTDEWWFVWNGEPLKKSRLKEGLEFQWLVSPYPEMEHWLRRKVRFLLDNQSITCSKRYNDLLDKYYGKKETRYLDLGYEKPVFDVEKDWMGNEKRTQRYAWQEGPPRPVADVRNEIANDLVHLPVGVAQCRVQNAEGELEEHEIKLAMSTTGLADKSRIEDRIEEIKKRMLKVDKTLRPITDVEREIADRHARLRQPQAQANLPGLAERPQRKKPINN